MHSVILAINWQPEIRGIITVLIAVVVLMGSVYLLLGTNIGARLGFLVAVTGLFGWMTIMGAIWWVYGIGLQGKFPSWQPVEVVVGDLSQGQSEILRGGISDWEELAEDDPGRGQATAAADDILLNKTKDFTSTSQYQVLGVFSTGGETYPWWLLHAFHTPHYNLVKVQPVVPTATEPGKAPPKPGVDESQPVYSVLMIRDLGYRRRPAALITVGSLAIFLALAAMAHRRDKISMARTSGSTSSSKELVNA